MAMSRSMLFQTRRRFVFILLASCNPLILLWKTSVVYGEDTQCSLSCLNGAVCVFGDQDVSRFPVGTNGKPFDFLLETSRDGFSCACPPGLAGLRCDVPFESCNVEDLVCFHGGKCIAGLEDVYGNDHLFCNCNDATRVHPADGVVQHFRGKFCEEEIDVVETCDDKVKFCLNGGSCSLNVNGVDPCQCPPGFFGRNCEYVVGTVPDCNLPCKNGASCRLGISAKAMADDTLSIDFQFCECPQGFSGSLCEVAGGLPCSEDLTCLNFSECVEIVDGNGETMHHCNCRTANSNAISFAGRSCQYPATSFCSKEGGDFCVNGGVCQESGAGGCFCPDGFFGSRCEFTFDESNEEYALCTTQCLNGGICVKGVKEYGFENFDGLSEVLGKDFNSEFEHCACPKGFAGLTCEIQIEECGSGVHVCLHGAKCIPSPVMSEFICDCSSASAMGVPTAGVYCEHVATDICGSAGFCTNGGVCRNPSEEEFSGCFCRPGWEGINCEFRVNLPPPTPTPMPTSRQPTPTPISRQPTLTPTSREPMRRRMGRQMRRMGRQMMRQGTTMMRRMGRQMVIAVQSGAMV